jgi:hypothetical protein
MTESGRGRKGVPKPSSGNRTGAKRKSVPRPTSGNTRAKNVPISADATLALQKLWKQQKERTVREIGGDIASAAIIAAAQQLEEEQKP